MHDCLIICVCVLIFDRFAPRYVDDNALLLLLFDVGLSMHNTRDVIGDRVQNECACCEDILLDRAQVCLLRFVGQTCEQYLVHRSGYMYVCSFKLRDVHRAYCVIMVSYA